MAYSVSYKSFAGLQPPFRAIEPIGRGLFFFLHLTIIVTGVGFALTVVKVISLLNQSPREGGSVLKALGILGGGALTLLAVWAGRKLSARNSLRQQDEFLHESYDRLHCRDARFIETTENGLSFGCDCKTQDRPWEEFVTLAETDRGFLLCTKSEVLFVPADSFSSAAERTEFRAILSEKLRENKSLTARVIETACTRQDWRYAKWLHFKMGGWVRWLGLVVLAGCEAGLIAAFAPFFDEGTLWSPELTAAACAFAVLILMLIPTLRGKAAENWQRLKIWITEDAIYVQSAAAESRIPWTHVLGCMVDKRSVVLFLVGGSKTLIPKRCIEPADRERIETLLRGKLGRKPT